MEHEPTRVLSEMLDAFDRRDLDALSRYLAADMDYRAMEGALDDAGVIYGREKYLAYIDDWMRLFPGLRVEIGETIAVDDEVVICGVRLVGPMPDSSAEIDIRFWTVSTVRDGQVVRGREYATREEALAAT